MAQSVTCITLLVRNQQEALDYYSNTLGFRLLEDTVQPSGKRWLVVAPPGPGGPGFVLAQAKDERQLSRVGDQTGGKVLVVLETDTFDTDVENMKAKGVRFVRGPVEESWGKVVVFEDCYGNLWDLVGR